MYLGIGCRQLKVDFLNNCKLSQNESSVDFSSTLVFKVEI